MYVVVAIRSPKWSFDVLGETPATEIEDWDF